MEVYTKYKRNVKQEDLNLPRSIQQKFIEKVIFDLTHNVELKVVVRISTKQREFKLNKTETQRHRRMKKGIVSTSR